MFSNKACVPAVQETKPDFDPTEQFQRLAQALERTYQRRTLRRFLRSSLSAVQNSLNMVGLWAPAVARVHGVPVLQQFFQLLQLSASYGFTIDDYYRYRMYLHSNADAAGFLPLSRGSIAMKQLHLMLRLDATPLSDKRKFSRRCADAHLPIPQTIAEFDGGEIFWWSKPQFPPSDLFVKRASGKHGRWAAVWKYDSVTQRWSSAGRGPFDEQSLVKRFRRQRPLILQRLLENHSELAELGPHGLCTVRVVTVRDPERPASKILLSVFRMPVEAGFTDTFLEGIASAVDVNSGTLSPGVRRKTACAHIDIHSHPDLGAVINGRRLPLWKEVTALAVAAHDIFQEFPSVGWDIAITPSGPVLIEANHNWGMVLAQQPGSLPLGKTDFREHFVSWWHFGSSLPAT